MGLLLVHQDFELHLRRWGEILLVEEIFSYLADEGDGDGGEQLKLEVFGVKQLGTVVLLYFYLKGLFLPSHTLGPEHI